MHRDFLQAEFALAGLPPPAPPLIDTLPIARRLYPRLPSHSLRALAKALGAPVIVYVNGCAPYLDTLATLGADCLSVDWRIELATARTSP